MQEVNNGSPYLEEGQTHAFPRYVNRVPQRAPIFLCEKQHIDYRFFRKIFTLHRIHLFQSPVDIVDLTNEDLDHSASSPVSSSSSSSSSPTFEIIENANKRMKSILF